jgi:hypothetical protein
MIVTDEQRRPQSSANKTATGWTSLHSWIFLAIVAVGLLVVAVQNRYHYLSPAGLGKAYRIDKLFGGMQELDPNQGWIRANLQSLQLPQALSMADPSHSPMHMPGGKHPGAVPQGGYGPEPSVNMPQVKKEDVTQSKEARVTTGSVQQPKSKEAPELSTEEKLAEFKRAFPNFGKDEFLLANDDLYPDWKKNVSPKGTWSDFLKTYGDFIQWWNDAGSPPEPGFKLWKEFLSSGKN